MILSDNTAREWTAIGHVGMNGRKVIRSESELILAEKWNNSLEVPRSASSANIACKRIKRGCNKQPRY